MTFSLRWMLITLAVFGASAPSYALAPRLAVLATAQSFGQDCGTSPVPVGGPDCPACCESSSWLSQLAQRIPYVHRLFAVPQATVRVAPKVDREGLEAQHARAGAELGDGFAPGRAEARVATPPAVWTIQAVGHASAIVGSAPTCGIVQARVSSAVAGSAAPACGSCAKSCDGCAEAYWPVPAPARVMTFQAGTRAPFALQPAPGACQQMFQSCPTTPVAPPVATTQEWMQRTYAAPASNGYAPPMPPQVFAQGIQHVVTSMVPSSPPALKMQASQVNLSTSQMDISADRMQHFGDDVLLEGNVRIVLKRGGGEPVRVTAARVVVNLRDNSFRVGQAPPMPTPVPAAFATERVIYQVEPSAPAQPTVYQGPTRIYVMPLATPTTAPVKMQTPSAAPVPLQFAIPVPR